MTGDKAIRDAVRMFGIVAMFSFFPPGTTGGASGDEAFSADDEHDDDDDDGEADDDVDEDDGDDEDDRDDDNDDDDGLTRIRRWRAKRVRTETKLLLLHEWYFAEQPKGRGQVVNSFLLPVTYSSEPTIELERKSLGVRSFERKSTRKPSSLITAHPVKRLNGADKLVLSPALDSEVAVFHNTHGGNAIVWKTTLNK